MERCARCGDIYIASRYRDFCNECGEAYERMLGEVRDEKVMEFSEVCAWVFSGKLAEKTERRWWFG